MYSQGGTKLKENVQCQHFQDKDSFLMNHSDHSTTFKTLPPQSPWKFTPLNMSTRYAWNLLQPDSPST